MTAAAAWPRAVRGQTPKPVIGLLSGTDRADGPLFAIQRGLKEAGFSVGANLEIERRFAGGQFDRLPALARELLANRVALIIAIQSARAPLAAKEATATVPVVFAIGGDPVRLGLVSSLNKPGGNITGVSFLVNPLGAKRLELLRDLIPGAIRIGLLVNTNNPFAEVETRDLRDAATGFRQQIYVQHASKADEIDAAFEIFVQQRVEAVTFAADAMFNSQRDRLVALAARHRIPTMYFLRDFADAGGLMSYSGSPDDAYHLAGGYAGRILKGDKPANLPVQQSTRLELVINLKTAEALGLDVPPTMLARADHVIE